MSAGRPSARRDRGGPDSLPPVVRPYAVGADYVDSKLATGSVSLREFLAGFLSHYPWWIVGLYGVRAVFVRVLGMRQRGAPAALHLEPDDVPFAPGAWATIFRVEAAEEDRYWIGVATDRHLAARIAIVREPVGDGVRFLFVRVVQHRNWAGPVYLACIRPFHHMVVGSMIRAGLRPRRGAS